MVDINQTLRTGRKPIELFRDAWGDDFFDLGCVAKIRIDSPEGKIDSVK